MAWWDPNPKLAGGFPYGGPKIVNVAYPQAPQWPNEPFVVKADIALANQEQPRFEWSVTGPGFDTNVGSVTPRQDGSVVSIELPNTPGWYRVQLKVQNAAGMDEANIPIKVFSEDEKQTGGEGMSAQ